MTNCIHHLLPSTLPKDDCQRDFEIKRATASLAKSIALGILVGGLVGCALYFGLHMDMNVVAVGAGAIGLTSIVSYIAMRALRKTYETIKWKDRTENEIYNYSSDLKFRLDKSSDHSSQDTKKFVFAEHKDFSVEIRRQDLFESGAQAIVNASNVSVNGGRGINGEIHRNGGEDYKNSHAQLKMHYCSFQPSGHAAIVPSGDRLASKGINHVIVVVGPYNNDRMNGEQKANNLYSCYYNSLLLAHKHNLSSIAFPSIGTGIFGYNKEKAARISINAIHKFITDYPNSPLKNISIHFFKNESLENYENLLQ